MNTINNININRNKYYNPYCLTKGRQVLIKREKLDSKNLETISDYLNLNSKVWSEANALYSFNDFASSLENNSTNPLETAFKKYAEFKLSIENAELTDEHKKIHIKVLNDKFTVAASHYSDGIIRKMMCEKFMYKKSHKYDEIILKKYGMAISEVSRSLVILTRNFLDYMSTNSINPNSQEDMKRLINYVNKDSRYGDCMTIKQLQSFVY